jgi:hypothetical protein
MKMNYINIRTKLSKQFINEGGEDSVAWVSKWTISSDRLLSVKLVPTFSFELLLMFTHEAEWTPFQTHPLDHRNK